MKVSVAIATRNRAKHLSLTLESLLKQRFHRNDFEVVVCDHVSEDNTSEILKAFGDCLSLKSVMEPFEAFDVSTPKNRAISNCTGELIVVVDCGVICPPHFIESHFEFHLRTPNSYMAGEIHGWDAEVMDAFWSSINPADCPERSQIPDQYTDVRANRYDSIKSVPWLFFWGCNFSVPREALQKVKGFDQSFTGWGWDDLELGYRLHTSGLDFHMSPEAWCLHMPHPRKSHDARMKEATVNWRKTYNLHKKVDLELWQICHYFEYGKTYEKLLKLFSEDPIVMTESHLQALESYKENMNSSLLWGFAQNDLTREFSLLSPWQTGHSEQHESTIHSFGFCTPFQDNEFDTIVISSYWERLLFQASEHMKIVASYMFEEASRIGKRLLIFQNSESVSSTDLQSLLSDASRRTTCKVVKIADSSSSNLLQTSTSPINAG